MSGTKAKFYVSGLTLLPGQGAGIKLELNAVARGDRNASWAHATPIGKMEMTVQNPSAVAWWEDFMQSARKTGRQPELFIDVYPSEDGWPGDGHQFRPGTGNEGTVYGPTYCGECGNPKDADLTEYDEVTRKPFVVGKVHPNG